MTDYYIPHWSRKTRGQCNVINQIDKRLIRGILIQVENIRVLGAAACLDYASVVKKFDLWSKLNFPASKTYTPIAKTSSKRVKNRLRLDYVYNNYLCHKQYSQHPSGNPLCNKRARKTNPFLNIHWDSNLRKEVSTRPGKYKSNECEHGLRKANNFHQYILTATTANFALIRSSSGLPYRGNQNKSQKNSVLAAWDLQVKWPYTDTTNKQRSFSELRLTRTEPSNETNNH